MKKVPYAIALATISLGTSLLTACATSDGGEDEDFDSEDADTTVVVSDDNLNGLWTATVDGVKQTDDVVVESWSAIGIRLHQGANVYQLTRNGDHLSGPGVEIDVKPNKSGVKDDSFDGTIAGHTVHLVRDVALKPSIVLSFPKDRPYRQWLVDTIMPAAQQDRESYRKLVSSSMMPFLTSCELYKHGSWQRSYFKGTTFSEQSTSFRNVVYGVNNQTSTPRQMTSNYTFTSKLKANLADQSKAGLAISSFGMYFSTASGGALRMPMTPTSTAYFITDKPKRAELLGLVVMDTPSHGPLASTFGRQLLDMGAMPASDDTIYARTMMELLAKSDNHSAALLSGTGQSALTDWFSVMAIEDYRGVAFGFPTLGWGYNMTNVQFFGLVTRALARPGAVDSTGKPVLGQVIVGSELRPGDASYSDVLNHGNDMQEYGDMSALKVAATNFLRQAHPAQVAAVESALSVVAPKSSLDYRAQQDIFHFITAELYHPNTPSLKGAAATTAINAVVALFDTLSADSANFEAYLLSHGYTKSNVAAPKSTGF